MIVVFNPETREVIDLPVSGKNVKTYNNLTISDVFLLSKEECLRNGVAIIPTPEHPDERKHTIVGNLQVTVNEDLTVIAYYPVQSTDPKEVKKKLVSDGKKQAHAMLGDTDFYNGRKEETGEEMPSDIKAWRQLVRDATNTYEEALDACGDDVEAMLAVAVIWPEPLVEV